jgi:hypothetical protein
MIAVGILGVSLVYYFIYLRPRGGSHWQMLDAVYDPEDEELAPPKNIT